VARVGERVGVAAEETDERIELVRSGLEQRRTVAGQSPRVAARSVEELLVRIENSQIVAAQYTRKIYIVSQTTVRTERL